jgi:hypothetical protein
MSNAPRDLAHDLVLPALLFAALGGMTWAVRGCSGFGAMNGCVFAGVTWGAAWWFTARDPSEQQSRRYSSAWIILALTLGIGFSGNRGWMQWPSFFEGRLQTNTPLGEFVPISRTYGFIWLFIAGVPWAGLGACLLAWCGSKAPVRIRDWVFRIGAGLLAAALARVLFENFPQVFLPLYVSMKAQYGDLHSNPNLRRLINDNRAAITHLGLFLGFLACEVGRRDWKNVKLIVTVGIVNGTGWALCQNWKWAPAVWPGANFNFWRCWESSGGISIGIAYGIAYYLVNRPDPSASPAGPSRHPNLERFACYAGLVFGLGLSLKNGLKGWANIYLGHEEYYDALLWRFIGPVILLSIVGLGLWIRARPLSKEFRGDIFPQAYLLIWIVLLHQNIIAQLITSSFRSWDEAAFAIYYVILFLLSAVIIHHFHWLKTQAARTAGVESGTDQPKIPLRETP